MSYQYSNDMHRSCLCLFKDTEEFKEEIIKKRKSSVDIASVIEAFFDEKTLTSKGELTKITRQLRELLDTYEEIPSELADLWKQKKLMEANQPTLLSFAFIQDIDTIIEVKTRNNSNTTMGTPKNSNSNNALKFNYSTLSPMNFSSLRNDVSQPQQGTSSFGRTTLFNLNDPYDQLSLISNKSFFKQSIGPQIVYSDYNANEEVEGVNVVYNNKRDIVYISIDLLLEKIAINQSIDKQNKINNAFIIHYSKFISTELLIDKLLNAFEYFMNVYAFDEEAYRSNSALSSSTPGILPIGLVTFLNKLIIKKYEEEISKSQVYKNKLKTFYQYIAANPLFNIKFEETIEKMEQLFDLTSENEIREIIYQLKERKNFRLYTINRLLDGETPDIHEGVFHIDDWTSKEIALQLTSITLGMMNKIDEKELLFGNYISKNKKELSPNIIALIERFDKLSYFIIEEILSYDKKKKRAEAIEMFIDIAHELKVLHNYNDCMNIKSSLSHIIIKSLNKTWSVVQEASKKKLARIDEVLSLSKNFFNLKKKINNTVKYKKPYIPYLGLTLREISFLEEGSKYVHKENMMINLSKITNINNKIDEFFHFRKNVFLITPIQGLEILSKLNPKKERELEELGKRLEPIFTRAIKKQYVKRLTNTDLHFNKNIKFSGCISLRRKTDFNIENDFYY